MGLIPVWTLFLFRCVGYIRGAYFSAETVITSLPVSIFTKKRSYIALDSAGGVSKRRFYLQSVFIECLNSDHSSFRYKIDPPIEFKILSS